MTSSLHISVCLITVGMSIVGLVTVHDIVVMVEPVPLSPVSRGIADGDGPSDLLAEKVRQTRKLGTVSRSIVVELVDGDSVELHVAWHSKDLYD